MSKRAIIIGGSGQIGMAATARLLAAGWEVISAQRHAADAPPGTTGAAFDRNAPDALKNLIGQGADALIDCIAYTPDQARAHLELQPDLGHLIVISSCSAYRGEGMGDDAVPGPSMPRFPNPMRETSPRWKVLGDDYASRKAAMEDVLLEGAKGAMTILRPGAIHGPGCRSPREWWVLQRVLDGRSKILMANSEALFHTTHTANIAALIETVLAAPGVRALNIGDPDVHPASDLVRMILKAGSAEAEIVSIAERRKDILGAHPWAPPYPAIMDLTAATALGYRPATSYAASIAETCQDLLARAKGRPWRDAFPGLAPYPDAMFTYEAEDAYLAEGADA
ncbi:MAG: hypothetical protein U1E50_06490 [Caulobacteraceae bacterium]